MLGEFQYISVMLGGFRNSVICSPWCWETGTSRTQEPLAWSLKKILIGWRISCCNIWNVTIKFVSWFNIWNDVTINFVSWFNIWNNVTINFFSWFIHTYVKDSRHQYCIRWSWLILMCKMVNYFAVMEVHFEWDGRTESAAFKSDSEAHSWERSVQASLISASGINRGWNGGGVMSPSLLPSFC